MESHTSGDIHKNGSLLLRAVGTCPEAWVTIDGVGMKCLLDTGAQVSTITETFYRRHMSQGELVDINNFLRVSAANGQDIPYLGYIECNLEALGHSFKNMGFLVVKDPTETPCVNGNERYPE